MGWQYELGHEGMHILSVLTIGKGTNFTIITVKLCYDKRKIWMDKCINHGYVESFTGINTSAACSDSGDERFGSAGLSIHG